MPGRGPSRGGRQVSQPEAPIGFVRTPQIFGEPVTTERISLDNAHSMSQEPMTSGLLAGEKSLRRLQRRCSLGASWY